MRSRGFSTLEALIAVVLFGIAAAAILPAFMVQLNANTRGEMRTSAITVAQQTLEALRNKDTADMPHPTSGDPLVVTRATSIGSSDYEITTRYCDRSEFCPPTSTGSRHIAIEVRTDGRLVYHVETVFTQLD